MLITVLVNGFEVVPAVVFWMVYLLVVGLLFGLLFGLAGGLTFGEIDNRAVPNEGIHRSARNALFVALAFGLVAGLVIWHVLELASGLVGALLNPAGVMIIGMVGGAFAGLFAGLRAGGAACFKHFVLRWGLIRVGVTPWNYVRFLEYTAERILLRKVGGGYVFLHRMLLEHFAALYVGPAIDSTATAKSAELNDEL